MDEPFSYCTATAATRCAAARVGIASADEARPISLLPRGHIAVAPAERRLSGLDELFTVLPRPAEQTSSMAPITGPSRTAGIEQVPVRGAHGPGQVLAIPVG